MTVLNQRWFMQTLLDRKDRMSMYHGLEVRVPFCDYRIAQDLYGVPWEYKNRQGREKGLLRHAAEGLLPESVLWRKKSPYPKTFDPAYADAVRNHVKKLLDENAEMKHAVEQAAKEKAKALVDKLCEDLINREENGVIVVARELEVSGAAIKDIAFALRNKLKNLALVIGTKNDGKPSLAVILGDDIVARGLKAGDIVREAAKEINGGGGGQPFFATAGGKNPEGLDKAIAKALDLINEQLNK